MAKKNKPEEEEEEIEEYEVESIADHRTVGKTKRIEYHIKWKGYDSSENTWEPESSVHAEELVTDYWSKHGGIEARDALKGKGGKAARKTKAKTPEPVTTSTKRAKATSDKSSAKEDSGSSTAAKRRKVTESTSTTTPPSKTKKKEPVKKQVPIVKSEEVSKEDDTDDEEDALSSKHTQKSKAPEKPQVEEEEEEVETGEDEEEEEVDPDDVIQDANYRKDWDWKSDIEKVVEVQNVEANEKKNSYRALIKWKDGKFSLHPTEIIRSKCPQQLIDYYESKLVFEKK